MEEKKLKVSDLIRLKESDVKQLQESLLRVDALTKEYYESIELFDVISLEGLKRRFIGELQYLTTMYSKTKCYKNDTHTYLNEVRKRVKGETFSLLLSEGKKTTMASELVYSHPYYVERLKLIEDLIEFFIRVEYLHTQACSTLQAIIQSVSLAGKEQQQANHM
jgi:hypothetical protein